MKFALLILTLVNGNVHEQIIFKTDPIFNGRSECYKAVEYLFPMAETGVSYMGHRHLIECVPVEMKDAN